MQDFFYHPHDMDETQRWRNLLEYKTSKSTKGRMQIFRLQIQDMEDVFTK